MKPELIDIDYSINCDESEDYWTFGGFTRPQTINYFKKALEKYGRIIVSTDSILELTRYFVGSHDTILSVKSFLDNELEMIFKKCPTHPVLNSFSGVPHTVVFEKFLERSSSMDERTKCRSCKTYFAERDINLQEGCFGSLCVWFLENVVMGDKKTDDCPEYEKKE